MWKDLNDAQMRANFTVVRYCSCPVYITSIKVSAAGGLLACFLHLSNSEKGEAHLEDPGWDWSPVPTGFVNTGKSVFYVQRVPVRKYKHGLSKENISVTPSRMGLLDIFKTKQMGDTICRRYPGYEEAMAAVTTTSCQVAFHPDFALTKTGLGPVFLMYRVDTVGWYEGGKIVLGNEFKYLKELVQEVTHVNA
jgi:hypothetical protein